MKPTRTILWVIVLAFALMFWLVLESSILYLSVTQKVWNYFIAGLLVFGCFMVWASFVSLRKRILSGGSKP